MWLQAFAVPFMKEKELLQGNLGCLADKDKKTSETVRSVNLQDLYEISTVLLIGLASGVVFFFAENLIFSVPGSFGRRALVQKYSFLKHKIRA